MATVDPRYIPSGSQGRGPNAGFGDDPNVGTPAVREAVETEQELEATGHGYPTGYHEQPEDWGWHADLGKLARFGGIFSLIALALMITATQYNRAGTLAIGLCMVAIVIGLIWDRQRRKNSYRR